MTLSQLQECLLFITQEGQYKKSQDSSIYVLSDFKKLPSKADEKRSFNLLII